MQILKSAGIVKDRKEGTFIYYYLNLDISELNNLITLFCDIKELMKNVPERSNEEL